MPMVPDYVHKNSANRLQSNPIQSIHPSIHPSALLVGGCVSNQSSTPCNRSMSSSAIQTSTCLPSLRTPLPERLPRRMSSHLAPQANQTPYLTSAHGSCHLVKSNCLSRRGAIMVEVELWSVLQNLSVHAYRGAHTPRHTAPNPTTL